MKTSQFGITRSDVVFYTFTFVEKSYNVPRITQKLEKFTKFLEVTGNN